MTSALELITNASEHIKQRGIDYDTTSGERSMDRTVGAFNAITGKELSATEGWLFMVMLKAVRTTTARDKTDSIEDMIAYVALMGEEILKKEPPF